MLSFICVGPQRTASSWLDKMLRQHNGIGLPHLVKETFFWDQLYEKGSEWYYRNYFMGFDDRVLGEIAPTCFDDETALQRIITDNPQIKVLICYRDPIERTYSLYCHNYSTGRLKGNFSEALNNNPRLIASSKYSHYVDQWGKSVGRENVLMIKQEGVKQDPVGVLNDVCQFVGVAPTDWRAAEDKYGERAKPRAVFITAMANRVAQTFRRFGLHALPETAKTLGLKNLFYQGGSVQYPPLLEEDRLMLLEEFTKEYEWITHLPQRRTFYLSEVEVTSIS